MSDVMELGDADFVREVEQSKEPVLVDFTAEWCAPCKAIAPVIASLAAEYRGRVKMARLDVDRHQVTPERYGIRSMPTLLFFKDGRVVSQVVGAVGRARLEDAIRKVL